MLDHSDIKSRVGWTIPSHGEANSLGEESIGSLAREKKKEKSEKA